MTGCRRRPSQNEAELPLDLSAVHSELESHSRWWANALVQTLLQLLSAQGQRFQREYETRDDNMLSLATLKVAASG